MQVAVKSREIVLASRPTGWPTPANFELTEVDLPEPQEGEVLVRNHVMSVEPYMRGRMNDAKSYVPPFELGKPLEGGAVGVVVASQLAEFPVGTWVRSNLGWREYALAKGRAFQKIDIDRVSASAWLGVLGVPGFTAWTGLHIIGGLKKGDVAFISSASGAVGGIAGQLAKLHGATVIGSAGSPQKVRYVREELGFDAAFDYHDGAEAKLQELAPDGIDLYFDNVGGEQLEAALATIKPFGRIVACGMISGYNEPQPGPRNLMNVVRKRLTMRGFIIFDHNEHRADFESEVIPAIAAGRIKTPESFVDGLEHAPQAFIDMLRGGKYIGKVVVRLAPAGDAH